MDISDRLAQLRASFRLKAERELDELSDVASRVTSGAQASPRLSEDIQSAYQLLHRLAGSAGTFGYNALGAEARKLEQRLKPAVDRHSLDAGGQEFDSEEAVQQVLDTLVLATGLRALLDDATAPTMGGSDPMDRAADRSAAPGSEIQVILCGLPDEVAVFLEHALSNYGFCLSRLEVNALSLEKRLGMTIVVTSEDRLVEVSGAIESIVSEAGKAKPPVICVGRRDDFDNRYALADAGADALFSEPVDVPLLAERIERLANDQSKSVWGKILILDDDEHLAEHYHEVLQNAGFSVRAISNPKTILCELSEFCPDILLLDVRMGAYSGTTVAKLIRFDPEWLSLPIIYLSSEQDRQVQLEALAKGADEFMTKPVSDSDLVRTAQIRCYRARQLNDLLIRDSLTGLLKHSFIKQEVEKEHARCQRMSHVSVVAMLDLDHFKQVNDEHGHRMGDLVIKALASLLRRRLRLTDLIGRYGGEEFAVILPECTTEEAQRVMTQICEAFAGLSFAANGASLSVTLSVGVAALDAFGSGGDALNSADQALYERKKAGRNGVTVFHQG